MKLIPWKNNDDSRPAFLLDGMDREMERFFSNFFEPSRLLSKTSDWAPRLDLDEGKDEIVIKADLPGMKKEEITVSVDEGILTISGQRTADKGGGNDGWYHRERHTGSFIRSVTLPSETDSSKVKAEYKDGVLTVVLAKKERAKAKTVVIG
jgi:HSP20 family protein